LVFVQEIVIVPVKSLHLYSLSSQGTATTLAMQAMTLRRPNTVKALGWAVSEGGAPFHTTQTNAVEFPGAALSPKARVRVLM
jgi:hypothetical protein